MNRHPYYGAILMLLAAFIFAFGDALIKHLALNIPLLAVIFYRSLFGMLIIASVAIIRGKISSLAPQNWRLFLIRAILGEGLASAFWALKYIPLLEFVTIFYAAPLVVAVFSPYYLKEKVSRRQWLTILLGFLGIVIALRPGFKEWQFGHTMALVDMLCYAALMLLARKYSGVESSSATNLSLYPLLMIAASIGMSNDWQPVSSINLVQLFVLAMTNTLAMYLVFQSLKHANAAITAPLEYSNFFWAAIIGVIYFAEYPDALTIIGILVIIASGTLLVRQHT